MAKFNDQIEPIYALLRQVEDIRLSNDILEPEPTDYKPARHVLYMYYNCTVQCVSVSFVVCTVYLCPVLYVLCTVQCV